MAKPIKPPFNEETAQAKVKTAQDTWNTCNPEIIAKAYTPDSKWRNRTEFFTGRQAIIDFCLDARG
jgi:nuclear transport factor 2 (NTF2) superfamily protein